MYILGISCYFHDSAAVLIKDDKIIAACQEERFTRLKHTSSFPDKAIIHCLKKAGISFKEVNAVAFYEKPYLKFYRVLKDIIKSFPFSFKNFYKYIPEYLGKKLILPHTLKVKYDYDGDIYFVKHHLSHASSSFFTSEYDKANILTIDGVGEDISIFAGNGSGNKIKGDFFQKSPHSLGLLYSAITAYLGFRANSDEGKIMALADFGKPVYNKEFLKFIKIYQDGSFAIDPSYLDLTPGNYPFTRKFKYLLGEERKNHETLLQHHYNIAATLQHITEDIVIKMVNFLVRKNNSKNLCVAGGVFLNCVLNSKILEKTEIENLYIQPAAGDSGCALGAALYVYNNILGNNSRFSMENAYLGPDFSNKYIIDFLENNNIQYTEMNDDEIGRYIADSIFKNKIVGLFRGRMEFGPRALGNRSILANPAFHEIKEHLNDKVKHREWFRPFGISICEENLSDYLETDELNSYMLLTGFCKEKWRESIPGALHINNSVRYQTVPKENKFYYNLLKEFQKKSGYPFFINTSFNDNTEPIVCTPEDAYKCYISTDIDVLVLNNFLITTK